ncbi:MAG: YceI family protein [Bacteroidetes bacterium]|nr:YceI family protein [Bacteroidota bacterium]
MDSKSKVSVGVAQKEVWNLDKAHSKIQFSARHLIISEVAGHFSNFDINFFTGENLTDGEAEATIDVKSIDTGIADRDNHLRSADFFDAEQFPQIKFHSSTIEKINDEKYKLIGELKIKNISKPFEFDVFYGGQIKDPWGMQRTGFKATGTLNRFDYDLKWNALMETGGAVVGKNINITVDAEFTKQSQ